MEEDMNQLPTEYQYFIHLSRYARWDYTKNRRESWEELVTRNKNMHIKRYPELKDNIEELHIVAKGLLEYETLSGDEIKDLLKGIPPSRDDFDDDLDTEPSIPTQSVPKTGNAPSTQTQ